MAKNPINLMDHKNIQHLFPLPLLHLSSGKKIGEFLHENRTQKNYNQLTRWTGDCLGKC